MRVLCVFANEFPYGTWEPYLETEIKYYDTFDKVYIFSLQLRREHAMTKRDVGPNIEVIPIYYAPRWRYFINTWVTLFDSHLYKELLRLIKKGMSVSRLIALFIYFSRSHYEARKILQRIKNDISKTDDIVFYSYRFEYQPYVATLVKKWLQVPGIVISRAHGFDLYENRRKHIYIPMRAYLLQVLDRIYPCSNDGQHYLQSSYPQYKSKIITSYLGTMDSGVQAYIRSSFFRIVSCSTIVPIKRLLLLVHALKEIYEYAIEWTHFGDGPERCMVEEHIKELPSNIKVHLRGHIDNTDLITHYKEHCYDLFINVSESEGLPVSIMEATSFGIPCLVTDAGGTGEIIQDGYNGIVIPGNSNAEEIANKIRECIEMKQEEYCSMRRAARQRWSMLFDADKNYRQFVKNELTNNYRE